MLCFKSGGDVMGTAFACNDSKLDILCIPSKSCWDASLDAFDQSSADEGFCPDMMTGHTQVHTGTSKTALLFEQRSCLCRQWGLILGVVILALGLLPSFRSVRLLNIIALCGTNYSCLYFFIYAAKHGIRPGAFTRCTAATPPLVT